MLLTLNTGGKPVQAAVFYTSGSPVQVWAFDADNPEEEFYYRELDPAENGRLIFRLPVSAARTGVLFRSETGTEVHSHLLTPLTPAREVKFPAAVPDFRAFGLDSVHLAGNPSLSGTPARMRMEDGQIQAGRMVNRGGIPQQWRVFILFHELGHAWFDDEKLADEFALRNFLSFGYNMSQAIYALSRVLKPSPEAAERVRRISEIIQSEYNEPQ